jgi:hypothetical protein
MRKRHLQTPFGGLPGDLGARKPRTATAALGAH